jgi:hypothetical protein
MKKLSTMGGLLLMSLVALQSYAQDIVMDPSTQGRIVYTNGGQFSDSGREGDGYSNFEDNTMTLCSSSGESVSLDFQSFSLENKKDFLFVYDGMDVSALEVDGSPFTGHSAENRTITSSGNCLTFRMKSDFNIKRSGWLADIAVNNLPVVTKN